MKILSKRIKPLIIVLGGGAALMLLLQVALSFILPESAQTNFGFSKKRIESTTDAFQNISLEAQAAYVYDINSNEVLFEKRANDKLPLASVTKLMTSFVAREQLGESALIVINRDDLLADGDSGLRGGERWRLGDLLNAMLIISSNDAAHAIARFVGAGGQSIGEARQQDARERFIQMMNLKAKELELAQMEFFNESGLDIESTPGISAGRAGAYGSAHDVAILFETLWKKYPSTIEITALPVARIVSQDNIVHILPNTDEAIGKFSGLIASKTGLTDLAGGNLAIIFDRGINNPVVAVVLGSSSEGRFEDMAKLVAVAQKASRLK